MRQVQSRENCGDAGGTPAADQEMVRMSETRWQTERDEIVELLYRLQADHGGGAQLSAVRRFGSWAEEVAKRTTNLRWTRKTGKPERVEVTKKGLKALEQALTGRYSFYCGGSVPSDPPEPVVVPPNDWASLERLQDDLTEEDFEPAKTAPGAKVGQATIREAYLGESGFPGMASFAATLMYGGEHRLAGKQLDAGGYPGKYLVTLVLTRRGAPDISNLFVTDERQLEGDSHLLLPEGSRGEVTVDGKTRYLAVEHALEDEEIISFTLLPNRWGRLAKVQAETRAENAKDGSKKVYRAIVPILCDISFRYDVPLEVLQVNVVEATTLTALAEKVLDFPLKELTLDFLGESINYGEIPQYSFLTYLYKEGVSSPNMAYGFLCFFRVIEGIVERRRERAAKQAGKKKSKVSRPEVFLDNEVVQGADAKHFPEGLQGESFHEVIKHIDPTRVKVAHAYMHDETSATEDIDTLGDRLDIEETLSALRFQARHMARAMMLNEYWPSRTSAEDSSES